MKQTYYKVVFKKNAPQEFKGWGKENVMTDTVYNRLKDTNMYDMEIIQQPKKKEKKKK